MRRHDLIAMMGLTALSMSLGEVGVGHRHYAPRRIRPLTDEDSKSKTKVVGNKRSKRRNKAKGRPS
jgi:hypothetical protein